MPNTLTQHSNAITLDKQLRVEIDGIIQTLQGAGHKSAERTLAFRALQTARHWLGEDLAILGAQHPYPNGNNPANTVVDPPADVASRRSDERALLEWLDSRGGLGLDVHDRICVVLGKKPIYTDSLSDNQ